VPGIIEHRNADEAQGGQRTNKMHEVVVFHGIPNHCCTMRSMAPALAYMA
jgi:hypothetical protein